jgi:hypothetical protein
MAGGALMLLDAWNGLQQGTDAQKFAHAARMVLGANEVARAMNDGKGFLESTPILGGLQGIVAIASLKDTIQSGNPFAIASSFMTITNAAVATGLVSSSTAAGAMGMSAFSNAAVFGPQALIAVAICSIIFGSLFAEEIEYPAPPPAGILEIATLSDGSVGMRIKDTDGKIIEERHLNGQSVQRYYAQESTKRHAHHLRTPAQPTNPRPPQL